MLTLKRIITRLASDKTYLVGDTVCFNQVVTQKCFSDETLINSHYTCNSSSAKWTRLTGPLFVSYFTNSMCVINTGVFTAPELTSSLEKLKDGSSFYKIISKNKCLRRKYRVDVDNLRLFYTPTKKMSCQGFPHGKIDLFYQSNDYLHDIRQLI